MRLIVRFAITMVLTVVVLVVLSACSVGSHDTSVPTWTKGPA